MKYTPVIGLETHVELKTKSKMFCSCSADYFGKKPNTLTCPVCLGLPGALPVPNIRAIEWCIKIGLSLGCEILNNSKFDRKNYFYPDLPKGYQISQYDEPFAIKGSISLKNGKKIRIRRVHMEEDTGKLIHADIEGKKVSLIDFNRSGVPLVEIVTEPDFDATEQVVEYLQKLQQIIRYLDVSDADMEKGQMRLEPNISLAKEGKAGLPKYKVEVKNINSFRFVKKSIESELERQARILDGGNTPIQETRGFSESKSTTISQRSKEEAHDYRYFPEPDIPPIVTEGKQIAEIKKKIPELPDQIKTRFISEYGLTEYSAEILTRDKNIADYFEEAVKIGAKYDLTTKLISNHIINQKVDYSSTLPAVLVDILLKKDKQSQVNQEDLKKAVEKVLMENPKAVSDYKKGKIQIIGFLIGKTRQELPPNSSVSNLKEAIEEALK